MGLLDKIKDLFTDEEEVFEDEKSNDVKIKEIKNEEIKKKFQEGVEETSEHKLPTFMRNKILEEENDLKLDVDKADSNVGSRVSSNISNNLYTDDTVEIPKIEEANSFKFPVDFDDNDFSPVKEEVDFKHVSQDKFELEEDIPSKVVHTEKKKVADLYKDKITTKDEHKFKASPIISPIYGVLDKNYSKDEIKEINEDSYEIKRNSSTKNVDFESVRKKAYGSLSDDIKDNLLCENCEYRKESKKEKNKIQEEDNLVYDILKDDDEENEVDLSKDISFGDATENYYDYGVEYEPPKRKKNVKKEEKEVSEDKVKIVNSEAEGEVKTKNKKEVPPVKSNINLFSTLKKSMGDESDSSDNKDLELTDDLFNMIDSMYDERNDD